MSKQQKQLIAFALYPGVTALDLIGPLTAVRDVKVGSRYRAAVVAERREPMDTDTAMPMVATQTFAEVPTPFALFVPGSGESAVRAMQDEALLAYVRSAAETAEIVGATGNGALILAAAGLLSGRAAAIHWAYGEQLERLGATYRRERWVEDGKFLTAAGGSAGIDMMLALVARLRSPSFARLAQVVMEYDPHPPFGGIDWSSVEDARKLAALGAARVQPREEQTHAYVGSH